MWGEELATMNTTLEGDGQRKGVQIRWKGDWGYYKQVGAIQVVTIYFIVMKIKPQNNSKIIRDHHHQLLQNVLIAR